ncbi:hypothetical protein M3Y97_00567200 [Aphelenchoides bicaudatus]|nr:hypothetical protein M3Y97_00567200 [Aphelenchoides bicaudatus]
MKAIKQKLYQIRQDIPWSGTLDVTFDKSLVFSGSIDNDFEHETAMYNQALAAVKEALPRLEELNIPVFRPDDYFAEMSKTDDHMQKVRRHLIDVQKDKERSEKARRLRTEKKFALKTQHAALEQKQKNKRKLVEAVKNHRKGMKEQLETMLDQASEFRDMNEDNPKGSSKHKRPFSKMSRNERNKKYGFGGQKKRSKKNDKESFNNAFGDAKKHGGPPMKKRRH